MKQYFSFQWHITDECDQRCKHCYIFSEDNCKEPDYMTWKQMEDTFYNCLDFCQVYGRRSYSPSGFLEACGAYEETRYPFYHIGKPISFKR